MSDQNVEPRTDQPIAIAYVAQSFPLLTETFVYREVEGLRCIGLRVATFATWRPAKITLSQEARHLVDRSTYVFPISWPRFLKAHLCSLSWHPLRYVGTLMFVMTRRGESLRNRLRTFFHFCEAVYLAEEMRKQQIRHIHAHFCINAATIALVASRLLDISFSFTAHNALFTDRIMLKEKIRAARFVAAISNFTRQYLLDLIPEDHVEHKFHIVHCGISPDTFVPLDPKPVNDIPILLFVAQLCERKGAPVLVEACKILDEREIKFRCVIVGDGPQKAVLEQLVVRYALHRQVELVGTVFQESIQGYFQQADVFVLPCLIADNGDVDGVPVSLMEAMAMEVAAVSTNVSGIPELIEDGVSGLLVPEKNPLALADALQRLLEKDELRSSLGKNARRKIIQEFNIDRSARQMALLFEKYVQTNKGLSEPWS
jgi:colanic acid/amylovoran biosynthesis glycosyltransferase